MGTKKRWLITIFAVSALLLLGLTASVFARDEFSVSGDDWMDGYTLIITDADNIGEAYLAADTIEKAGGYVYIIFPNQVMLGKLPAEAVAGLIGKDKIKSIHQKSIQGSDIAKLLKSLKNKDEASAKASADAIEFFNKVISKAWKVDKDKARQTKGGILPDNLQAPRVNYGDVLTNLRTNGVSDDMLAAAGVSKKLTAEGDLQLSPGSSDYMVGKILFNAMFVESSGTVDANLYTWTAADRTTVQNEIVSGLSWWSNTARTSTFKTPLTFIYANYYGSGTTTGYEPILHSSGEDSLWINPIMAWYGYGTGDKWARTEAFNIAKRVAYGANWSVVSFVGYNPSPAASTFTDGYFAYTWSTYSQLLFRNDGWGTGNYDIVNAHETGHLFGASDEYYQAGYGGCTSCAAASNGVINGNCEFCNANAQPCMMRGNSLALCGYTPGQIGWASLRDVDVFVKTSSGAWMDFYAAGQSLQYQVYYCLAGPRLGTTTHPVQVRFRAEFAGGTIDAPSTVFDDTGWGGAGSITPPTTTGLSCYYTFWTRSVPAGVAFGPATLSVQLTVGQYGKLARSNTQYFFAAPGASSAASPLPSFSVGLAAPAQESGPFTVKAPEP